MIRLRMLLTGNPLITVRPSATALEAAKRMVAAKVGAVLVVNESGHPCGLFSERDLMRSVVAAEEDPSQVIVADKMTKELLCAHPDNRVGEIARKMRTLHIRHLPIVENEVVIELLSFRDLLHANLNESEDQVEALTTYIQGGVVIPPQE